MTQDRVPGYPEDLRTPVQQVRGTQGPYGDFELAAARVVARATGARVVLQDDNSADGMPDLRIDYVDGRRAFGEVVLDLDPGQAALVRAFSRGELDLRVEALRWQWWLTLSGSTVRRDLPGRLEAILADMEVREETYPLLTSTSSTAAGPGALELASLGITEVACADQPGAGDSGVVRCLPGWVGGEMSLDWPGFYAWLVGFLASDVAANKRAKLSRTGTSERHCFIGLGPSVPWSALHVLDVDVLELPPAPPSLPPEITHLWLWGAGFPDRSIAWWPDRGWLDVAQNWVTQ